MFELELHNHHEKVTEVCTEATQELNNEEQVRLIDEAWKNTNFKIALYPKKGDNLEIYALVSPDEIREQIEDNIMTLQGVGASKYAKSVKGAVAKWEKDLMRISDCIDVWMQCQKQWIYLEAIFSGEDIKQQLPDQARKFTNIDKKWGDIMDSVKKNKNVRNQCVVADGGGRFEQLEGVVA